MYLCNFIVRKN